MRIKSKNELNFVHVAVLAVCSLISLKMSVNQGLAVLLISAVSYILALFICLLFFKKATRSSQGFVSALIAAFVVFVYQMLVKNNILQDIGMIAYYSILPSMVLSIDSIYLDSKESNTNYFVKIIRLLFVYSLVLVLFVIVKELLAYGTINGEKLFEYEGYKFFENIIFDLLLLGVLSAIINRISNVITELYNEKVLILNKYKTKVRSEKVFLYDNYRRKKLLTSEIITNKVSGGDELFEEIEEVSLNSDKKQTKETKKQNSTIKHKPKKNKKLKVSKEAKVEQLFKRTGKNEEDDK